MKLVKATEHLKRHIANMATLFQKGSVFLKHKKYKFRNLDLNLETPRCNQVSLGTKSLCMQDSKFWNFLLFQIKSKKSKDSKCSCNVSADYNLFSWYFIHGYSSFLVY